MIGRPVVGGLDGEAAGEAMPARRLWPTLAKIVPVCVVRVAAPAEIYWRH